MLGWIFKKRAPTDTPAATVSDQRQSPPAPPPAPRVDWDGRLAQARGDDAALLALLQTTGVPVSVKQAAVEALVAEAALVQAERDSRNHDRRVHQLAKRRLQAAVAVRQAREQAARLIETARSLTAQADAPANRGVELDRAWQALDASALEPSQRDEFAALSAHLAEQLQSRADAELHRRRWLGDAERAVGHLRAASAEAAAGTQDRQALADALAAARPLLASQPADTGADLAAAKWPAALDQSVRDAELLDGHLAMLDRVLVLPVDPVATPDLPPSDGPTLVAEAASPVPAMEAEDPLRDWQALAPLANAELNALVQGRFKRWQQVREQSRRQAQQSAGEQQQVLRRQQQREAGEAREASARRPARPAPLDAAQLAALDLTLQRIEGSLDAGQLAEAQQGLAEIDKTLQGTEPPPDLQARLAAAQARWAQLRGWQHWAGGRAREDLVLQAEALAAATRGPVSGDPAATPAEAAPAESDASAEPQATAPLPHSDVESDVARLSIRQRADLIATLRDRWKEIDRAGGAGGRALWLRFDAALKIADEPVAAHLAAQRAVREANLAARLELLSRLEASAIEACAWPAPGPTEPEGGIGAEPASAVLDAQALAQALDRFHAEWRKLGPLEHTVPKTARSSLARRVDDLLARVEAPLQAARLRARAEREGLVDRARALAAHGPGRDLVAEVRGLQAEWQQHARALALARGDEQALWKAFKAAIDGAFAARDAAAQARDSVLQAHADERKDLIGRLQASTADNAAGLRRLLAEVDAAWQRCGPAPRALAAGLEAEFRAAREALIKGLDDSRLRAWQATCDALDTKLALCEAQEQEQLADDGALPGSGEASDPAAGTAASPAEALSAAWQALSVLPAPFEDALRRRAGLLSGGAAASTPDVDDLLLQIETAWSLPTPPAFEAARRERKLLAMKAALEGRRTAAPEPAPEAVLAMLLEARSPRPEQAARLQAVLAAWRRRGPERPG